jgi:ABC-type glycerol-3-phosphate transport system permease component
MTVKSAGAHVRKRSNRLRLIGLYAALVPASLFALAPIYWAVNTSLKLESRIIGYPPHWWPSPPTLEHYFNVLLQSPLPRNYLNSALLAAGTIALVLFLGMHAAYAAARFRFPGKNGLLFVLLATVMVPGIVTLIPVYLMAVRLGLHDTHLVLILVFSAWQTPTVVWLLRAFFENIPRELDEAALIDGCSQLGAFYRVVLPLAQPGLAAAAILVFVWVWNEFIIALNLTASDATRPLTVGLFFFVSESGIQWGKMAAAACVALVPVILLFAILQRRFIQGLTAGATKG